MMDLKKKNILILSILVMGAVLRIWGLSFGLPFQLHQDEPIVVNHALAYGAGDLNPHFFIIPPLCSYLLFFAYGLYFILGKIAGLFAGTEDLALEFFSDPGSFYLIARTVLGVIPGILSIWLVYVLYRRLFSDQGAWYAAAVFAFTFLGVVNAHYAYVDNVMLLLVLMVYCSLSALIREPSMRNYLLSGVLFGIAVSTKYNAAILAVSCYIAHITAVYEHGLERKKLFLDKKLWAAFLVAAAAFVLTNPFSVIDWRFFAGDIFGKIRHSFMGWSHHISYSLFEGMGFGLVLVGILGLVMILVLEKRLKGIFFLSFPVVFYLHLVLASQRFSRYVLPLVPFLSIGAAYLLFRVLYPLVANRFYKGMVIVLSLMYLIPTTAKSIKADILFSGKDTRALSAGWIKENLPPGAKIAVDHTSFRPQVSQTTEQLIEKYDVAGKQEGLGRAKEKKLRFMLKAIEGEKTYNVYFLTREGQERGQFLSTVPAVAYDIKALKREGIEYVVINYNTSGPEKDRFIGILQDKADVLVEFSPYYDKKIKRPFDRVDTTFMSVASEEIFSRDKTGPCLVIYRIK
ncbi:MAG: glycosyltransferase family 39 protein [Candidatus Omnitrophota bacterium]